MTPPAASPTPRALYKNLRGRLYALYVATSLGSVTLGGIFFLFGLDLTATQMRIIYLAIVPVTLIPMLIVDFSALNRQVRPIGAFLLALPDSAEPTKESEKLAAPALVRALNMPFLALLRVMLVHMPAFGIPSILLTLFFNQFLWLGIHGTQFAILAVTIVLFAAAHAIAELFGTSAMMQGIIPLLRRHAGPLDAALAARVVRVDVRRKLLAISAFAVVVPLIGLGATMLLKAERLLLPVEDWRPPALSVSLEVWVGLFVVIASLIAMGILAAMAREVASLTGALREAMRKVESGALGTRLDAVSTDEFADLFEGFNRMTNGLEERERLRDAFGRYVAPEIAETILKDGVSLGGTTVSASVLFADIRGFTSMSERLKPHDVVALLNRYVAAVEPALRKERGWINKFGGDSILAVFGAPMAEPDHAALAVRAALGMRKALSAFNVEEQKLSGEQIEIGIGVHTGEMVAGSLGSPDRMEYSVIGDVVNVASRLQSMTKELGVRTLISAAAREAAGERCPKVKELSPVSVRGKSAPMAIYTLDDAAGDVSEDRA
jgi:adenylate cyclase